MVKRQALLAAILAFFMVVGVSTASASHDYPGDVNHDGTVDFSDLQALSNQRPDDAILADLVRNWGTDAPPAVVATTASATLTPGDRTIKADWSLDVGTDGANGAILSRDGLASDNGSTVGWTSPNYLASSGSLTFINLYNDTEYSITVQPTKDGVAVGTPLVSKATPVAPIVDTTSSLTVTPGDTTLKADWSLNVGTDGANGAVLSRNGESTDSTTEGWTSPNYVATSGSLTFIALYNGREYTITVQPTKDGVPVGTPKSVVATPVAATSPPPPTSTRGPGTVDLSTQGTVRTTTCSGLNSALSASSPGDTVAISAGSCPSQTISRSVTGGLIRVVPVPGAVVNFSTTTINGDGLDFRGFNSSGQITFSTGASNVFWRGGTHTRTSAIQGFYLNGAVDRITVEDVLVRNPDSSFYLQGSATSLPTNVVIQRFRSENVAQDHVFISRGNGVVISGFQMYGHTDTSEHSDGIQIVGGKDVLAINGEMSNPLSLRDNASDRNDHGVMVNYDPNESAGRVPERITIDGLEIHNQTSSGIAVAGVRTMTVRNSILTQNGRNGTGAYGLIVDPDSGNVVSGWSESNNTIDRRSVCCIS